jgi:C-terminal binding protein
MTIVLYPEGLYADDYVEREVFGRGVTVRVCDAKSIAELSDADCADVDGLMTLGNWVRAEDFARFPKLRAVVRMGVGYDRIDRAAAAAQSRAASGRTCARRAPPPRR